MFVLFDIVAFALVCFVIYVIGNVVAGAIKSRNPNTAMVLKQERKRRALAEKYLRDIANGNPEPIIHAGMGLDEIERTYASDSKELN